RHRKLEPLQVAVGEHRARPSGVLPHPNGREEFIGALDELRAGDPPGIAQAAMMREQRHLDVLAHRHRTEGRGDLEGAPDTEPPDPSWRHADRIPAQNADGADIGRQLAHQHVEAGRLAGPVRPDQRDDLAGRHFQADVVDRDDAAEGPAQAGHLEQRLPARHAHRPSSTGIRRARIAPAMPAGNSRTSSRMTPPSKARQYWVSRASESCSQVKAAAPTIGPVTACTPPSRTITSASTERPIDRTSGEMLPLENAYKEPAKPPAAAAMMNTIHCTRPTSMPMASARKIGRASCRESGEKWGGDGSD